MGALVADLSEVFEKSIFWRTTSQRQVRPSSEIYEIHSYYSHNPKRNAHYVIASPSTVKETPHVLVAAHTRTGACRPLNRTL